jgi:sRNA-binding regulator protein Hfq
MNSTLSLKKKPEVKQVPEPQKPKGPDPAHLNHWNGRKVTLTLTTGDKVSGRMVSIAKYDVLMRIDGEKVVVHKQHLVMCELAGG